MRNRGKQRTSRFVEPALRTPHTVPAGFANPRGLVRGYATPCPRLDTRLFGWLPDAARPSAGKGAKKTTQAPLASPARGEPP